MSYAPGAPKCEAICTTHGQRCRARARHTFDGKHVCGHHLPPEPEADGDGQHVAQCNQLIVDAMRHPDWATVPGEIRHLIEHAWVALSRATGES